VQKTQNSGVIHITKRVTLRCISTSFLLSGRDELEGDWEVERRLKRERKTEGKMEIREYFVQFTRNVYEGLHCGELKR
jgi:hypothetical protein